MNCKKFVSGAFCYMFLSLYLPSSSWTIFRSTTMRGVISCIREFQICWLGWEKCRRGYLIFKELTNPDISAGTQKWDGISYKPYSLNTVCREVAKWLPLERGAEGMGSPLLHSSLHGDCGLMCLVWCAFFYEVCGWYCSLSAQLVSVFKSWSHDLNCTSKRQFEVSFVWIICIEFNKYLEEPWCLFKISWFLLSNEYLWYCVPNGVGDIEGTLAFLLHVVCLHTWFTQGLVEET